MRSDEINNHLIELIQELNPKYWFIENPRGGFRKMDFMKPLPRYTVTYCKYGEKRMKPTDIWTNHPQPNFIPPCKNGDTCHEAAPRGARTGTQSLKNRIEKARIPVLLCEHIVDICESVISDNRQTIILGGKCLTIYVCDRKASCNKSKFCGKECKHTFDPKHEEKQISMTI